MRWKRPLLPVLLSLLAACAEGGIRGSGISTSVLGNVAGVAPQAADDLGNIRVAVEGAGVATRTASDGSFALVGGFDGVLTLRFSPPGGGTARLAINVPTAGTLTLNDVRIDTAEGTAMAESQDVDFDGVVVSTDCSAAAMVMDSAVQTPGDVDHYIVDLATSVVEDAQGRTVVCDAVPAGAAATLSGHVYPDGVFGDALIVLTE